MSILIAGLEAGLGRELIPRLLGQGDEVRVIDPGPGADAWRGLGAYVARGTPADEDLVERAAQNVRTMVVVVPDPSDTAAVRGVVTGCRMAAVERVVLVVPKGGCAADEVAGSGLQYVVLITGRRGLVSKRSATSPSDLAEAIDAADDLAGAPELTLDLTDAASWPTLGLPVR